MLEKLYHEDMEGSEPRLLTTVLTCEGDLRDPAFPFRLQSLVCKLKRLISEEKKPFWVTKIEPWNSVRVTFTIPHEAALRLRQLAEQGDQVLRDLGILSVQIEGDQVITLTLANRYSEPQEIVFKTSETQTDHISDVSRLGSDGVEMSITSKSGTCALEHQLTQAISSATGPVVSCVGNEATVRLGPERNFISENVSFRSPNVVAPNSSHPLPFKANVASSLSQKTVSKKQTNLGPFPFASMTYAMNTKHAAANQQNSKPVQGCSSRFPFTPPLQRSASSAWKPYISNKNVTTAASSISVVNPTAVTNSQPSSCTSSPGLLTKFPNSNFSSNLSHISPPNAVVTKTIVAESSKASVVLSSPLLVNLLQNETNVHMHSNKITPSPSNPSTQPPVKRRKPRKSKEKLLDSESNSQFSPRTPSSTSSISTDFDQISSKSQPFRTLANNIISSPIPHIHPQAEGQPQVHTGNLPLHTRIPFRTIPISNFPSSSLQNRASPPRYGAPPVCTTNTSYFTSKISSPIKESEKIAKVTSATDSTPFPSPPPSADGKIKHLINPFTGQLEPMPSDEDEDECIGSLSLFPELEMMDTNESGSSDKHIVENYKDNICSSYYEKGKSNTVVKSSNAVILDQKAKQNISTNQIITAKEELKSEKQNCSSKQLNKEQRILSDVNTSISKMWKKVDRDNELSPNILSVCHSDFAALNGEEHNVPCSKDWKLQTLLVSHSESFSKKNLEGETILTKNENASLLQCSQINSAYLERLPNNSDLVFQNKASSTTQEAEKNTDHISRETSNGLEQHNWKTLNNEKRPLKNLTVLQVTGIKTDKPVSILSSEVDKKQKANSNDNCHIAADTSNKPHVSPVHLTEKAVTFPVVAETNSENCSAYGRKIATERGTLVNNMASPSVACNSVPYLSNAKLQMNLNNVEVSKLPKITEKNQFSYQEHHENANKISISATSQFPLSSLFHNTENQSKCFENGSPERSCSLKLQILEENECQKDKFGASEESKSRDIYQTSESPKIENGNFGVENGSLGVENGISCSPKSEDSLPSVMCDTPDSHTTIGASSCDQDIVIGLDANLNSGLENSRQLSDINEGEELKRPLSDKALGITLSTQPHFETPPDSRSPISLGVTAHDRLPPEQVINTLEMMQKGGILINSETKNKNKSECRNSASTMHILANGILDSASCGQEQNIKDKTRLQYITVPVSHQSKLTATRENTKYLSNSRGCLKMQSSLPSAKSDHAYFNMNRHERDNLALRDHKNMENEESYKLLSSASCTPIQIPNLHKIYVTSEKQEFESKSDIPIDIGDISKVKSFKTDNRQQKIASVAKIISLNCLTDQKSTRLLVVPSLNKLQNFPAKSIKKDNMLELSAIPSLIPSDGNVVHNLRLPIQEDIFEEMLMSEGNGNISPPQYTTFSTHSEDNSSKPYSEESNQFHNRNHSSVEFPIHYKSTSLNSVIEKVNALSKSCLTQEIDNVDSQSSEESSLDSVEDNRKDLTINSQCDQKDSWNTSSNTETTFSDKYPQKNSELQKVHGFPVVLTSTSLEGASFKSVVSKCEKESDKNTSLQESSHCADKFGLAKHVNSSKGQLSLSESSHKIFDFNDSNISKPPEQLPLEIFENSESESQSPAASLEVENTVLSLNVHQQLPNISDACYPTSQNISSVAANVESHPSSHISRNSAMITKVKGNINTASSKGNNVVENSELQKLASKCVVSNKEISQNSSCSMVLDTSSSETYTTNLYSPQIEKTWFQSTDVSKTSVIDWLATTSSTNVLVPVSTSTSVPIRLVTLPSSACGQFLTDNLIEARTTSSLSFPYAHVNNSCASSRLVFSKTSAYPSLVSSCTKDTALNTSMSETVKAVEPNRIPSVNSSLQNCLVNSTVDSKTQVNSSIAFSSDSYLRLLNSKTSVFKLNALEETEKKSVDNNLFETKHVKEDDNKNNIKYEKQMESNNLQNINNSLGIGKSSVFAKNNAELELPFLQFRTVPHKSFPSVDDRLVNEIKQKLNISKELKSNISSTGNSLVLCNLSETKNYSNKKCLTIFSDKSLEFSEKKPNCSYYDELSKCFPNKNNATNSQNQLNKYHYRLTMNGTDTVRPECADGVHTVLQVNDDVHSVHINSKRNIEPKLNTSFKNSLSSVSDSKVVSQLTQKSLGTVNSGKKLSATCAIVELGKSDVFEDRELFNSKRKYHIFPSRTTVVDNQEKGEQKEDIGLNGRPHFLGYKLSEFKRKMYSENTLDDEDLSNVKRRRQSSDSLR